MVNRILSDKLTRLFSKYPVVTLTGPRQSGKTMLVKALFGDKPYVSFENPEIRRAATLDPRMFIDQYAEGAVFDEAQYIPDLFSYIQLIADEKNENSLFVLTGSQNFLLMDKITQSLAGRTAVLHLFPFSLAELQRASLLPGDVFATVQHGFYPRMFDKQIPPADFYPHYIQTYMERDVRTVTNIADLNSFTRFIALCAARVGQLLNVTSLANEAGVSLPTAKKWLSILEAGFLVYLLKPYHKNYNKRLVKQPKLYFTDTGLLCWYLGIHSGWQLANHFMKGAVFENFVIIEHLKRLYNRGEPGNLWFWRDNHGKEVDLLVEDQGQTKAYEVKSSQTFHESYFKSLQQWSRLSGHPPENNHVIYAGEHQFRTPYGHLLPWSKF